MRMDVIVASRPLSHEYTGVIEVFDAVIFEEFVSHPVMEGLNESVMPGLTGWDERLNRLIFASPLV